MRSFFQYIIVVDYCFMVVESGEIRDKIGNAHLIYDYADAVCVDLICNSK